MIEYLTEFKVAVVYGALPPEIRRQQAALFNTPGNGCMLVLSVVWLM